MHFDDFPDINDKENEEESIDSEGEVDQKKHTPNCEDECPKAILRSNNELEIQRQEILCHSKNYPILRDSLEKFHVLFDQIANSFFVYSH